MAASRYLSTVTTEQKVIRAMDHEFFPKAHYVSPHFLQKVESSVWEFDLEGAKEDGLAFNS